MKATILTMAGVRSFDNHEDALHILGEHQEEMVLTAIQLQQLSSKGILILIEGYATIQKIGTHRGLLWETIPSHSTGNNPNTESLYREVVYFDGRGILALRVTYTTSPLKRIVYDITGDGDIREAHV